MGIALLIRVMGRVTHGVLYRAKSPARKVIGLSNADQILYHRRKRIPRVDATLAQLRELGKAVQ